jgi:predicted N-acyltransferase
MELKGELSGDLLDEAYGLYMEVVNKHEMGFEKVPKEFFRRISDNMPGATKYFFWRVDGKLAAFLLCIASDKVLIDYYIGFDYDLAHEYHLYFIKFRDVLEWCVSNGIKKYDIGYTGYEAKKRLGFRPKSLFIYFKLSNRFIRPVFNRFSGFLKFENFDPALRKIKKEMKA